MRATVVMTWDVDVERLEELLYSALLIAGNRGALSPPLVASSVLKSLHVFTYESSAKEG